MRKMGFEEDSLSKIPERIVAQYGKIQTEIGYGTFSSVYITEKRYVIKSFNWPDAFTSGFKEYSLYQNLSGISGVLHPLDFEMWSEDGEIDRFLMVFPYGEKISDRNSNGNFMDDFISICKTVSEIHSRGIWHLDLKPQNLIRVDGKVFLIDFGNSYSAALPFVKGTYTSLHWRAPENYFNLESSEKSDVWSLGMILLRWAISDEEDEKMFLPGETTEFFNFIFREFQNPLIFGYSDPKYHRNKKWDHREIPFSGSLFRNLNCSLELLKGMLQINPKDRFSIDDVLQFLSLERSQIENCHLKSDVCHHISSSDWFFFWKGFSVCLNKTFPTTSHLYIAYFYRLLHSFTENFEILEILRFANLSFLIYYNDDDEEASESRNLSLNGFSLQDGTPKNWQQILQKRVQILGKIMRNSKSYQRNFFFERPELIDFEYAPFVFMSSFGRLFSESVIAETLLGIQNRSKEKIRVLQKFLSKDLHNPDFSSIVYQIPNGFQKLEILLEM